MCTSPKFWNVHFTCYRYWMPQREGPWVRTQFPSEPVTESLGESGPGMYFWPPPVFYFAFACDRWCGRKPEPESAWVEGTTAVQILSSPLTGGWCPALGQTLMDKDGEDCSPNHVVMIVANTTLHLSLSSPAQEVALGEKLCLRCCDMVNYFQIAPGNLLSTTPLSLEQRQMSQTCPEDWLLFSFRAVVSVDVYCACSCPIPHPPLQVSPGWRARRSDPGMGWASPAEQTRAGRKVAHLLGITPFYTAL